MGRQAMTRAEPARAPAAARVAQAATAALAVDSAPEAVALRRQADALHAGAHMAAQRRLAEMLNAGSRAAAQRRLATRLAAVPARRDGLAHAQGKASSPEQAQGIAQGGASTRNVASFLNRAVSSDAPVQRTVQSRVYELKEGGTKRTFYSTYDPSREFDDHFEAWAYDTELARAAAPQFDPSARYPTNVSYYRTKPTNVMGTSKQGPHSLSHSSLSHRLDKRMRDTDASELRDQQVVDPREFAQLLEAEKPTTMKRAQAERMLVDYQLLYDRLDRLLDSGENGPEVYELIMRLIQMNPYSAYGKGKTTGKKNIKGHGERKEASFDEAFDKGAKFRDEKGYEKFRKTRQKLFSDEESSSEEGSHVRKKVKPSTSPGKGDESASSSESAQVLTPLQVMVRLHRTTQGALYILSDDDWAAYDQYKRDHPENRYSR